jgi:TIR domain
MVRDQVFISYSHRDSLWLERLRKMLKPSIRAEKMVVWDDTLIKPGTDWREEIKKALAEAKVAVLLVSSNFLASDFIATNELPVLLKAANDDGLTILWVAVSYCAYKDTDIERYQAVNKPDRPLAKLKPVDADRELVKICDAIKAASPATFGPRPVEETTRSAGEGIKALIELMSNPVVQGNVVAFKAVLETSCRQIDVLAHYKDLHDLLHTLQFQCYKSILSIVRAARRSPDDPAVWDDAYLYDLTLQNTITRLNQLIGAKTFGPTAVPWIQTFVKDLTALSQALQKCDVEEIEKALRPINKVLNIQPSRINDRLDEAARAVPLPTLVDDLTRVRNNLTKFGINSSRTHKFEDGLMALSDLNASLVSLIESHSKWQEIDVELRRIEANTVYDFSELEFSWPDLKRMVDELCASSKEQWAQALVEDGQKLEGAISLDSPAQIKQYFQRFRTRAGSRFYQVDFNVKELCGKLRLVGDPLATILEMI